MPDQDCASSLLRFICHPEVNLTICMQHGMCACMSFVCYDLAEMWSSQLTVKRVLVSDKQGNYSYNLPSITHVLCIFDQLAPFQFSPGQTMKLVCMSVNAH